MACRRRDVCDQPLFIVTILAVVCVGERVFSLALHGRHIVYEGREIHRL
ncbi:MAG: hypothetical protein KatS3mg110_3053 [Pirellulaceae bacterium]|nr:MAG: hypothetical protein KatS3mg110_3053 [Pirellulaceae bacterium]